MNKLQSTLNVSNTLKLTAKRFFDKEAIVDGAKRITYGALDQDVTSLARGLVSLGVKSGDRVGVALKNSTEFITAFFAIARAGAVLIPLNPFFSKEECSYIVQQTGAKVLFCGEKGYFVELQKEITTLNEIISVGFQEEGLVQYDELLARQNLEAAFQVEPKEDLFAILFTSGTTGRPKGAMLTHENVLFSTMSAAKVMECTEEDIFLIPNPLFHIFGVTFILRSTFCGGKLVMMEKYSVTKALELIEAEKVTVHPGVPTMFILELNSPDFKKYDLSSLRTGEMAAAPCPVEVVERIRKEMNCNVLVAYGMTETSATLTITSFEDTDQLRAETVGRAIPGVELKIVDENRAECPVGKVGELACRGPGVTKGYDNMPEETATAIDHEGWFYSGDLAAMDEKGYVRIVGRKKEMIIKGGFNIYPREIEESLHKHPDIVDAAVIGLPDDIYGEVTCACVVAKEGVDLEQESLQEYIQERFVKYKVPDKFIIMDNLPVTASGKISKLKLTEELKKRLNSHEHN
ncbi:class I adenylate-forming enzyme family protein [Siminovitchia terrae]|uniref:class I adenylate-forming enzyme family protein n=1 Tax=Siminovitchia terrae TaxID=1914933 RepID=UPI0028A8D65B|nr:long-chain-fatty-acid--CoA ligase [Siminovitchia terrae]